MAKGYWTASKAGRAQANAAADERVALRERALRAEDEVVRLREELEYIRLQQTECLCSGSWGVNHKEFHQCARCKRLKELKAAGRGEVER